jgi:dihydroflavonol-4-reductase
VVFHLAARIAIDNRLSDKVLSTNITGTINLLNAARQGKVKKFIHFSSIEAFQTILPDAILDENGSLIDINKQVYGFSKAEGERAVLKAAGEGLDAVILSPTAVIGPYDYRSSLLGQALIKIHQNRLPFLISGGYNWVDVRDVVAASVQATESGRKGEKYILSGNFCSLKELSSMIRDISGCRIPPAVPVSLARLACPFLEAFAAVTKRDPLYTQQSLDKLVSSPANISYEKAGKELNYRPLPIEQTLMDTFNWYRENKFLT